MTPLTPGSCYRLWYKGTKKPLLIGITLLDDLCNPTGLIEFGEVFLVIRNRTDHIDGYDVLARKLGLITGLGFATDKDNVVFQEIV